MRPILKPPSNKNESDEQLLREFISTVYKNVVVTYFSVSFVECFQSSGMFYYHFVHHNFSSN